MRVEHAEYARLKKKRKLKMEKLLAANLATFSVQMNIFLLIMFLVKPLLSLFQCLTLKL